MAILTLAGCKHPIIKTWGDSSIFETDELLVTCMVCYERLVVTQEQALKLRGPRGGVGGGVDRSELRHAPPAARCEHRNKNVIEKDAKYKHGDYTDALCEDCGVVLRHPEGPGGWHEVIFNGYVIREEP